MTFKLPIALAAAVSATMLITVTACSSGEDHDTTTHSAASTLLPPAEGKTTYPVTLATPWGETTLEERPERIASLGSPELLAALGVTPVAAMDTMLESQIWTREVLEADIELRYGYNPEGPPLEEIAALEPDLIVDVSLNNVNSTTSPELLEDISPVSAHDSSKAWQDNIKNLGVALDLQDRAQQVIDDHDRFFTDFRDKNPDYNTLTSSIVVHFVGGGFRYYSAGGSDVEKLLVDMGFDANPAAQNFTQGEDLSDELISSIVGDILIVTHDSSLGDFESEILSDQRFRELNSVRNGHLAVIANHLGSDFQGYEYNSEISEGNLVTAMTTGGPLSSRWAAERLAPILQDTLS